VVDALGKPSSNVPFMMPARIASTPPDEQIKEVVGSRPFQFAKVYVDEVVWRYIPDAWDAADELAAGNVEWWEQPPLDFVLKLQQHPDLQIFVADPGGTQGWLRPNCLHPPFNNRKAREALAHGGPSDVSSLGLRTAGIITGLATRLAGAERYRRSYIYVQAFHSRALRLGPDRRSYSERVAGNMAATMPLLAEAANGR
jgi:Bacterial extracellular solute-binding proteins, family 5 Middle